MGGIPHHADIQSFERGQIGVDLIDLDTYLAALEGLDISVIRDAAHA